MTGTRLCFQEIEQIKILRASGLSFHAISLKVNRDPKSIKKTCLDPMISSDIKDIQEELADSYEGVARRMIDSISDEDILKINAYQRMVSSGIATDKMRLLRNESTENLSIREMYADMENLDERRIEIEQRLFEITGKKHGRMERQKKLIEAKGEVEEGATQTDED
jgi:hypothetical protein